MVLNVTEGSILRIDPARARRDDGILECRAENGIGEAAIATAKIDVYAENQTGNVSLFILASIVPG